MDGGGLGKRRAGGEMNEGECVREDSRVLLAVRASLYDGKRAPPNYYSINFR